VYRAPTKPFSSSGCTISLPWSVNLFIEHHKPLYSLHYHINHVFIRFFRVVGRNSVPDKQTSSSSAYSIEGNPDIIRFALNSTTSELFAALCQRSKSTGKCQFQSTVILPQNLNCSGIECKTDTARVVTLVLAAISLDGVNYTVSYEYIRQPCVDFAFFENPTLITTSSGTRGRGMCADPKAHTAQSACCVTFDTATCLSEYHDERISHIRVSDGNSTFQLKRMLFWGEVLGLCCCEGGISMGLVYLFGVMADVSLNTVTAMMLNRDDLTCVVYT
jgi:hypothetical protein